MATWMRTRCLRAFLLACMFLSGMTVRAQGSDTIKTGIYAGGINLSGMTAEEATQAIQAYVEGLRNTEITLLAAADTEVAVTAGELGVFWANPELVTEALEIGVHGNVIERYKVMKDLENDSLVYPIRLSFSTQAINDILLGRCAQYDRDAVNATLTRENGQFLIEGGSVGYTLDTEASIDSILHYLTYEWDCQPCTIALEMDVEEPAGSAEELAQVTDVLGAFTTSFASSNANRCANIENGCVRINGTLLYPGDAFSTYDTVAPFTEENGYHKAGSYLNGKVVDSLGGGICQVSTTLYNAVLLAELEVTQRSSHSMIVTYVEPSADAAIASGSAKDFKFVNSSGYPVYIEGVVEGKEITFTIYGKETRASNREVVYESVILETNKPAADDICADAAQPVGYIVTEGAHIGYKAQLWKVVLEDGEEVIRTQVNSSSYKMVPRSATVGTATGDPAAYEEIMAAIGTGSIDHVKNVIAALTGQ